MINIYKLLHSFEVEHIQDIPAEVIAFAKNILTRLDTEYGICRTSENDGGEVIILSPQDDLAVLNDLGINIERLIPEYTDIIQTSTGDYIHSLILTTNDYTLSIIMENSKASHNLLDC